jgi:hypothetical protein
MKRRRKNMPTSHNQFLSILTGAVAGALVTFGLVAFRSAATPVQAQAQATSTATAPAASTETATVSPTPFVAGPEVEGGEIGEGISREGGVFINDLASKLNVPVDVLESDISGSFNVAINQAVQQGFVSQADASQLAAREANLFTSGSGFIFDIDEFPGSNVAIPVTGATLAPTATPEVVTATPSEEEENDKDENSQVESKEEEKEESAATEQAEDKEQHEASPTVTPTLEASPISSPTPLPSKTPRATETPRSTRTPRPTETRRPSSTPSSKNNPSATPMPSMTPLPTLTPTRVEDFSLFYAP